MIRKRSLKINYEKLKVFLILHIAHTIAKSLYCLVYDNFQNASSCYGSLLGLIICMLEIIVSKLIFLHYFLLITLRLVIIKTILS